MKFKFLILLLFLNLFFVSAQNINRGEVEEKRYLEKLSYTEIGGMIIIKVSINNEIYNFHLDTGAPFVISKDIQDKLNLKVYNTISLIDVNGKINEVNTTLVPKLNIRGITFTNSEAIVLDGDNFIFDCLKIDGVIGSNILRNSVLQFDYKNKFVHLANDVNELNLEKVDFQELILDEVQSDPSITIFLENDKNSVKINATIDSGFNDFFTIPNPVFNKIVNSIEVFNIIGNQNGANSLGLWGIQDESLINLIRLPQLIVNEFIFKDIVFFSENSTKTILGNRLYEFGKTTLDYKQKRFYFEPYENIDTSELSSLPFSIEPTFENNKLVVGFIWDDSLKSKVNLGDEILFFDGINYQDMDLCEFVKIKSNIEKDNVLIELKDVNSGEIKKLEIKRINLT